MNALPPPLGLYVTLPLPPHPPPGSQQVPTIDVSILHTGTTDPGAKSRACVPGTLAQVTDPDLAAEEKAHGGTT